MKIAFISLMGGLPWGGSEALWHKTAQLALAQGLQVFVSVYDWGKQNSEKLVELKKQGAIPHFRKKWDPAESVFKKIKRRLGERFHSLSDNWKALVDFKPDAVLINQGDNFDLVIHHQELYNILKNNIITYSFICHNHAQYSHFLEYTQYQLARKVYTHAKTVWFVSHRQWQLTERKLCIKLSNAQFTWNPLNLNDYNLLPWPPMEIIQMAIVGNLVPGKGHDTLFQVLSDEKWKSRNYQLNIYGTGEGERYLQDLCNFYQLTDKVLFKGYVSSATEIWMENHILLIPSSGEGLPISLVEAAICGRPAVVTDVGGNSEIVEEGKTGFIACAPTVNSFSKALEQSWQNRSAWVNMGLILKNNIENILNIMPEIAILNKLLNKDE